MFPSPGGKTEAQRGKESSKTTHPRNGDDSGRQGRTRLPASRDILCPPRERTVFLSFCPLFSLLLLYLLSVPLPFCFCFF